MVRGDNFSSTLVLLPTTLPPLGHDYFPSTFAGHIYFIGWAYAVNRNVTTRSQGGGHNYYGIGKIIKIISQKGRIGHIPRTLHFERPRVVFEGAYKEVIVIFHGSKLR